MTSKNYYLRLDPLRKINGLVIDEDHEVIKNFAVVTKGVTHDKRGEIDDEAMKKIVKFGNSLAIGHKARFGHPNMSVTALGTFLGRVKNFKLDNDIVRADLFIDKTSHDTPDGDLGKYVMDLAKSDPMAFGSSMVISWNPEYRIDKNNVPLRDKDGHDLPPLMKINSLLAVDIVDDPAANNGFFENSFYNDQVKLSAEMTSFLDKMLQDDKLVNVAKEFLDRYNRNKNFEKDSNETITLDFNGNLNHLTMSGVSSNTSSSDITFSNVTGGGVKNMSIENKEEKAKLENEEAKTNSSSEEETSKEQETEDESPDKKEEESADEGKESSSEDQASNKENKTSEFKYTQKDVDQFVSQAVKDALSTKEKAFSKDTQKLNDQISQLKLRLDQSEAEKRVEKSWTEKYSSMYSKEDAPAIKAILKKMELGQALSTIEVNTLVDKKSDQDETLKNSDETFDNSPIDPERKNRLAEIGGIKFNKNKKLQRA